MSHYEIPAFAERGADGIYTISFPKTGKYKIIRCGGEELLACESSFLETSGQELQVSVPFPHERAVFAIKTAADGKIFYVSERLIPMEGTPNFRDLGGIVNKHGRQIKWGKIFRSGILSRLTDADLEYFKTLKIKTVIDFRSDFEVKREPSKFPADYQLNYIKAPVGNPVDFHKIIELLKESKNSEHAVNAVWAEGASELAEILPDFKPVFNAMLAGNPFLFHCSAGKDRTGLASALILSALDVERDIIFEDYLLSNKYTIPYFKKYLSMMTDMGIPEDVAVATSGVRRELLETTLDKIIEKYGTFDSMLSEVFGIDYQLKSELIDKYTY